jgi:CheY-like chemotaxis protein
VQQKSLFGTPIVLGTKFESKLRIFREKNYKFSFALLDAEQLANLSDEILAKKLLSHINCVGIHSNITHYFFWKQSRPSWIPTLYSKTVSFLPRFLKLIWFWILFVISWVSNYVQFVTIQLLSINMTSRTKIQTLQTREFLFEMLKQAEEEKRSILYIDFDPEAGKVVEELVTRLFPELEFTSYIHNPHSLVVSSQSGEFYIDNPHWYEARQFLAAHPADIIFLATRDSAKDELQFLEKLKSDDQVNYQSILMSDVREFTEGSSGWLAKTKLRLFSLLVLEQFFAELDTKEFWIYKLALTIKTEQGIVVDSEGNLPHAYLYDPDKLELKMVHLLSDMMDKITDVEISGKIKRKQNPRVLPSFKALMESDYQTVRIVDLEATMKFTGTSIQLKDGYQVK